MTDKNSPWVQPALRLGLGWSRVERGRWLAVGLRQLGFQVVADGDLTALLSKPLVNSPDVWLLDADDEERLLPLLAQLDGSAPVLINTDAPPCAPDAGRAWLRRLAHKLEEAAAEREEQASVPSTPCDVWLLAASTGGPEAVKSFLRLLAPGLPVALIYGQHLQPGAESLLASLTGVHYPARFPRGRHPLQAGGCWIVPVSQRVKIDQDGLVLLRQPWPKPYSPALDQLGADIARSYPGRCGLIVFSGMGEDAALAARCIARQGGQVWVQSPGSCTIDSMPNAVLRSGHVTLSADPASLAQAFNHRYGAYQNTRGSM